MFFIIIAISSLISISCPFIYLFGNQPCNKSRPLFVLWCWSTIYIILQIQIVILTHKCVETWQQWLVLLTLIYQCFHRWRLVWTHTPLWSRCWRWVPLDTSCAHSSSPEAQRREPRSCSPHWRSTLGTRRWTLTRQMNTHNQSHSLHEDKTVQYPQNNILTERRCRWTQCYIADVT